MDKKYKVEIFKINSTGEYVISNMKNIEFSEAADIIQHSATQALSANVVTGLAGITPSRINVVNARPKTVSQTVDIYTVRGFNREKIEAMVNKFNGILSKKPSSTLIGYKVECVVKGHMPVIFDYNDYDEIATAITSEQQSGK